jgi:hypothetical protein
VERLSGDRNLEVSMRTRKMLAVAAGLTLAAGAVGVAAAEASPAAHAWPSLTADGSNGDTGDTGDTGDATNGHIYVGAFTSGAGPVVPADSFSDGDIRIGSAPGDPDDGGEVHAVMFRDPPGTPIIRG